MCSLRQRQHMSLILTSSGTLLKLLEWNLLWKTKSTCVIAAGEGLSAWILSVWMNSGCFWVFVRTLKDSWLETLTCSQNERRSLSCLSWSDTYTLSWTMTFYLHALDIENKRQLEYLHVCSPMRIWSEMWSSFAQMFHHKLRTRWTECWSSAEHIYILYDHRKEKRLISFSLQLYCYILLLL